MDQEKLSPSQPAVEEIYHNVSPSQKTAMPRWKYKGKEQSTVELLCSWIVDHQISIAVSILSTLFLTHYSYPRAQHHTHKFFQISYYNPGTGNFASGWDDLRFVFFWIIVFTGMRCAVMEYILAPIATWAGLRKKKPIVRFAEQAWIMLYYGAFWLTGMYIYYSSGYWLSLEKLWTDFPTREVDGLTKWYYLVQFAFWLQQIVVVNIEERRKDHWQMFTHHIITCTLIFTSYGYHNTKVGNVILCLMDLADIILPLAKILKYLKFEVLCDAAFGVFMITWFVPRHVFYLLICWSIWAQVPHIMRYGCYRGSATNLQGPLPVPDDWNHLVQPFYDPEGLVCMDNGIRWFFFGMLSLLQAVLLVWFVSIIKVAWLVISGGKADDIRSDDEEEEDSEIEEDGRDSKRLDWPSKDVQYIEVEDPLIEEEAWAEDMHFKPGTSSSTKSKSKSKSKTQTSNSTRRAGRRNDGYSAATTAVSFRGSTGDRKELLGRIGCDHKSS